VIWRVRALEALNTKKLTHALLHGQWFEQLDRCARLSRDSWVIHPLRCRSVANHFVELRCSDEISAIAVAVALFEGNRSASRIKAERAFIDRQKPLPFELGEKGR